MANRNQQNSNATEILFSIYGHKKFKFINFRAKFICFDLCFLISYMLQIEVLWYLENFNNRSSIPSSNELTIVIKKSRVNNKNILRYLLHPYLPTMVVKEIKSQQLKDTLVFIRPLFTINGCKRKIMSFQ